MNIKEKEFDSMLKFLKKAIGEVTKGVERTENKINDQLRKECQNYLDRLNKNIQK